MAHATKKPNDSMLSMRVHPSIAAALFVAVMAGTWRFITDAHAHHARQDAQIATLNRDVADLRGEIRELATELRRLRERVTNDRP